MKKIIEIDLNNKSDLIDKYNKKKVSNEFIKYIIKQALLIEKSKEIKIIINKNSDIDEDCLELIKKGLEEEHKRSLNERDANNVKQVIFLILGSIFLFLSMLIKEMGLWKEILLIIGWVPIWEMIEVELFPDVYGRRKRSAIRRILNSEIVINNK